MKFRIIVCVLIFMLSFALAAYAGEPEITTLYDVSTEGNADAFDINSPAGALRDFSNPAMRGEVSQTGEKLLKINLAGANHAHIHGDIGIKTRRDIRGYDFIRFYIENDCSENLYFYIRFDVYVEPDHPLWDGPAEGEGYAANVKPKNFFFESLDGDVSLRNGTTAELPGNFKGWLYVMLDENMEATQTVDKESVPVQSGIDMYKMVLQYVFFFYTPMSYQETNRAFDSNVFFGDVQLLNYSKDFKYDDIPAPVEDEAVSGMEKPSSTKKPVISVSGSAMTPQPASSYEYYLALAAAIVVFAGIMLLSSAAARKRKVKLDKTKDK